MAGLDEPRNERFTSTLVNFGTEGLPRAGGVLLASVVGRNISQCLTCSSFINSRREQ